MWGEKKADKKNNATPLLIWGPESGFPQDLLFIFFWLTLDSVMPRNLLFFHQVTVAAGRDPALWHLRAWRLPVDRGVLGEVMVAVDGGTARESIV